MVLARIVLKVLLAMISVNFSEVELVSRSDPVIDGGAHYYKAFCNDGSSS